MTIDHKIGMFVMVLWLAVWVLGGEARRRLGFTSSTGVGWLAGIGFTWWLLWFTS